MLTQQQINKLKDSFYGWEYCVDNNITPTITHEDVHLLNNVFIDLEDNKRDNEYLRLEIETLRNQLQHYRGYY